MKKIIIAVSLFLLVLISFFLFPLLIHSPKKFNLEPYGNINQKVSGDNAYSYIKELTSDTFEGRQPGLPGSEKAAQWIADQFADFGLQPINQKELSYLQPLEVPYYDILAPLLFEYREGDKGVEPVYRNDFIVFPDSGSGHVESEVVFVGYGATTRDGAYNDYTLSVEGKIVIIMLGRPTFLSKYTDEFMAVNKIRNAKKQGAKAVMFIDKTTAKTLYPFDCKWATGRKAELPVLYLSKDRAKKMVHHELLSLADIENTIEQTKKPYTFSLGIKAKMEVNPVYDNKIASNVIGYIPAINPSSEESIIIGAHYDHLGKDNIHNTIYRGANDNASGTSCMMEVAKILSEHSIQPNMNIIFIAFTGEEIRSLGSEYYLAHPLFPAKKIKAMINLDEVGRGDGKLIASLSQKKYPDLFTLIKDCSQFLKINITFDPSYLNLGSDHYYFNKKGIPTVYFVKQDPSGYKKTHRISDTLETIHRENLRVCCSMVSLMTLSLTESVYIK